MNDYISDLLARLQNGIMRRKETILVPNAKSTRNILEVLKQEEMIEEYVDAQDNMIEVAPVYFEDGAPVVEHFIRVSKPGQRVYVSSGELIPVMNGRGIDIISTSTGVMTGSMAKSKNLGGELICKVW